MTDTPTSHPHGNHSSAINKPEASPPNSTNKSQVSYIPCNSNCDTCSASENKCETCVDGYELIFYTYCRPSDRLTKRYKNFISLLSFLCVTLMCVPNCLFGKYQKKLQIRRDEYNERVRRYGILYEANYEEDRVRVMERLSRWDKVRVFDNGLDFPTYKKKAAKAMRNDDKSEQCAICLDELTDGDIQVFPCLNHAAHVQCVR